MPQRTDRSQADIFGSIFGLSTDCWPWEGSTRLPRIVSATGRQLESDSWPGGDDTGGGVYDSKPTSSISTSAGSMPVAADEEEKTPECDIYLNESAPAHSIPFRKRSPVLEVLEVEPVVFRHVVSLASMMNVTSAMRREITKLKSVHLLSCSPRAQPDPSLVGLVRHPPDLAPEDVESICSFM